MPKEGHASSVWRNQTGMQPMTPVLRHSIHSGRSAFAKTPPARQGARPHPVAGDEERSRVSCHSITIIFGGSVKRGGSGRAFSARRVGLTLTSEVQSKIGEDTEGAGGGQRTTGCSDSGPSQPQECDPERPPAPLVNTIPRT